MSFALLFGELAADQALDGEQRVLGVGHGLALGRCADEDLAVFLVSDDGRRGARTFAVFDHAGGVAFHDGNAAVGGAQVNADDFSHVFLRNVGMVWMASNLWITWCVQVVPDFFAFYLGGADGDQCRAQHALGESDSLCSTVTMVLASCSAGTTLMA